MADYLSPQDLVNAKVDAKTLGEALNDEKVVKPRYGKSYDSFPLLVRKLLDGGGFRPFPNEQAIKDYVPTVTPSVAKDMSTYKLWLWDKGTWTDTGLSELDRANENLNSSTVNLRKEIQFVPATEFNDGGMVVVDQEGRWLNDYVHINRNLTKTVVGPFSSFSDRAFEHVDNSGAILSTMETNGEGVVPLETWPNTLYVSYKHKEKSISAAWIHDEELMLKTVWQPNGANNLFNFRAIYKARIGDPANATWELIQQVSTDYIPPITHEATTGGTTPNVLTTGGNHTGANGELTAYMQFCNFYLNHLKLENDFKGYVANISVCWQNLIYAGNTINEKRFTTQQDVFARFHARNIEVNCEVTALEPIKIWRDGGAQLVGQGWEDSYHFYNGVQQERLANSSGVNNGGTKQDAPNQWAVVLKSLDLGYCAAFVDRTYGIQFDAITDVDTPTTKNVSSYKFYNFVVKNEANQFQMTAGQKYAWRGGYAYAPISIVNGLDSAFVFNQANRTRLVVANTKNELTGKVNLKQLSGTDFDDLGSVGVNGLQANFTKYEAKMFKESN